MPDPSHLAALLRLAPRGLLDLDEGSLVRLDLANVGTGLDTAETQVDLLLTESRPQGATALLARWETLYGLRNRGLPDATRRRRIIAKARLIPDMCPDTIEGRCEEWTGMDPALLDLIETGPFRCNDAGSLCDDPEDVVDGAFVFIIALDSAEAHLHQVRMTELYALLEDLKPAHTVGIIRCDDFFTDDSLSLTDCDLLGA